MQRYATRIGLMGLAFLLAASLSTASRAGDVELFADLIPGTPLSYEELGDIYGRGLDTEGEFLRERFNGFSAGEFIRERLEQHQRDTERLERRIGKLSTILGQTERELAEMTQAKLIDPGEASIYKTVQGLDMAAGGSKRKAELLSAIFEANLSFQRKEA